MAKMENPGALAGATGAEVPIPATAEGTFFISGEPVQSHRGEASFIVQSGDEPPANFTVKGRVRWALDRLRAAGPRGCTPITEPAPRWSAYVHSLRELGLDIETVTEKHGSEFPGNHARYVLRSIVREGGAA